MKESHAKALVEASEGSEYELILYERYSGRCMYGRTTWAVYGARTSVQRAIGHAARDEFEAEEVDEFIEAMGELVTDSLGRDTIFY